MINKTRLLTGLMLGSVLSTPALAEEYKGFYFSVWGGAGMTDMPSRTHMDKVFDTAWVQNILTNMADDYNNRSDATGTLTLTDLSRDRSTLDDSTSVWGALVGYRFNKWVGMEIGYVNLGEVKYDFDGVLNSTFVPFAPGPTDSADIDYAMGYRFSSAGPTASVVAFIPASQYFDFTAKAGIFLADTRQTVRVTDVDFKENFFHDRTDASQTELFAGIGANWNATPNVAIRVEYQKFFNVGDDSKAYEQDIDVINVGVLFK